MGHVYLTLKNIVLLVGMRHLTSAQKGEKEVVGLNSHYNLKTKNPPQ